MILLPCIKMNPIIPKMVSNQFINYELIHSTSSHYIKKVNNYIVYQNDSH